ncbi:MAG: tRNA lysidine(34) synthetase TilS [Coriobacteriia bacterium]|nr:tRNA lysidine(34) synthetase TilS [Coriobacteriia bacterium]
MPSISDIARATTERRALLDPAAPVLAMVSGGADSVTLLRLLAAGELGQTGPLSVLHVDHMLRGDLSDADAAFVSALCDELGVPCTVVRFDVAEYAAAGSLNLEDAGRRVRYRFADEALDAACEDAGVRPEFGRIATAHSRDDRVETFLMRAITGAGAGGLASIPYQRGRIVRPLLDCDRAAIRDYLAALGQPWHEDASNADTSRLRARVRAEIVPIAESINPAFRETLSRSMDLLGDDDALLARLARDFGHDFAETTPDERVAFDREWMHTLDRAMARRAVRAALIEAFPEASRLEASHVEALVDGLADDSFARDLPGNLRAETEYGRLVVSRTDQELRAVAPSLLPLPGTAELGDAGSIVAEEVAPDCIAGTPDSITIAADSLGSLVVDGVRPGDRMRVLGMDGSRKLSDLLVDEKVVRRQRHAVPVVRDAGSIVWLAGVRMSEDYRVMPTTARAMRLTWYRP